MKIKELLKAAQKEFIIIGYEKTGISMGDDISYLAYGTNPRWFGFPFSWFERKYYELGYALVPDDAWMLAGGFGKYDEVDRNLRIMRRDEPLKPGDIQKTTVEYETSDTEADTVYYTINRNTDEK